MVEGRCRYRYRALLIQSVRRHRARASENTSLHSAYQYHCTVHWTCHTISIVVEWALHVLTAVYHAMHLLLMCYFWGSEPSTSIYHRLAPHFALILHVEQRGSSKPSAATAVTRLLKIRTRGARRCLQHAQLLPAIAASMTNILWYDTTYCWRGQIQRDGRRRGGRVEGSESSASSGRRFSSFAVLDRLHNLSPGGRGHSRDTRAQALPHASRMRCPEPNQPNPCRRSLAKTRRVT
jgi:hypothetical protein